MNELETAKIAAKKAGDAIKKYYKAKYEKSAKTSLLPSSAESSFSARSTYSTVHSQLCVMIIDVCMVLMIVN